MKVIGRRCTVDGQEMQYEDLNSKSQIPNSKQAPNSKFQFSKRKPRPVSVTVTVSARALGKALFLWLQRFNVSTLQQFPLLNSGSSFWSLGNWNLEFIWNLVLGIWNFILAIASFLHVNRQPSTVNRLRFMAVTLRLTPYALRRVLQVPLRCIHDPD